MAEHVLTRAISLTVVRDRHGCTGQAASVWRYDPSSPYEVSVQFQPGDAAWQFARETVSNGLSGDPCLGDVSMWTIKDQVMIRLESPEGTATFAGRASQVREFLLDSYALVARGDEVMDFTDVIDEILRQGAS